MLPMRFIHDDQTGGPPGVDRGQQEEQRANPAFHVELDRKRQQMLPQILKLRLSDIFMVKFCQLL